MPSVQTRKSFCDRITVQYKKEWGSPENGLEISDYPDNTWLCVSVCVCVCMTSTPLTLQYIPATALATDAARVARLHGSGAGASGSRPSARACSSRARCSQVGRVTDAQPYTARAKRAGAHGTRHTHTAHAHGTRTHTHTRSAHKRNRDEALGPHTQHTHTMQAEVPWRRARWACRHPASI